MAAVPDEPLQAATNPRTTTQPLRMFGEYRGADAPPQACDHRGVTRRETLEAELATAWDRETLAVYADELQAEGDPRGELIALDLELETRRTLELVTRRTSLLTGWLGKLVPSDPHAPWIGDSFRLGFVEDLVLDDADPQHAERLTAILGSPLAPYLRRVTIRGGIAHVGRVLAALAAIEHRWLVQLAVTAWDEGPVDPDSVTAFVAATPALARLDVERDCYRFPGTPVFDSFPHRNLQSLRVTGHDPLASIHAGDNQLDGVTELDVQLFERVTAQIRDIPAPWALPSLRRVDLSRNEPMPRISGYEPDFDDLDDESESYVEAPQLLDVLQSQPLRHQLTHVRLPSLRTAAELERLETIVAEMRALEEVEVARGHYLQLPDSLRHSTARFVRPTGWPWPRPGEIVEGDLLHVLVPGCRSSDTVAIVDAAYVMERRFEELDADARYAWTRFWTFVAELGALPWKSDARIEWTAERTFPASLLVAAVEACDVGGSGGWRELRDQLRFRRPFPSDAAVTIHRERTR